MTFGALVIVGIGHAFAMNAGDGSASVHRTSEHIVWPVAVFYAISAAGPYVRDPGRRGVALRLCAHGVADWPVGDR